MSLIEEALRRLQDPSLRPAEPQAATKTRSTSEPSTADPTGPAPVIQVPPAHDTAPAAPAHSWSPLPGGAATPAQSPMSVLLALVAAVAVLTLALIGGGIWWTSRMLSRAHEPGALRAMADIAAPPGAALPAGHAPVAPPSGLAQTPATDTLMLSGVVEGDGESYAVINGSIVMVGERLGDFTLEAITDGSARLRGADGAEITLRVPR